MTLAHSIMRQIFGPFEAVPSPVLFKMRSKVARHISMGGVNARRPRVRCYVMPNREAMEWAAEHFYRNRDWLNLAKCARNLFALDSANAAKLNRQKTAQRSANT